MIVSCPSCQRNYVVADEQIAGKQFRARCKSCGVEFRLNGMGAGEASGAPPPNEPAKFMSATEAFLALQSTPPPNAAHWSVCLSQTDTRRMSTDEIVQAVSKGTIKTAVFVWRNGMGNWLRLNEVPELVAMITKAGGRVPQARATAEPKLPAGAPTGGKLSVGPAKPATAGTPSVGPAKPALPSRQQTLGSQAPPPPTPSAWPAQSGQTMPPPALADQPAASLTRTTQAKPDAKEANVKSGTTPDGNVSAGIEAAVNADVTAVTAGSHSNASTASVAPGNGAVRRNTPAPPLRRTTLGLGEIEVPIPPEPALPSPGPGVMLPPLKGGEAAAVATAAAAGLATAASNHAQVPSTSASDKPASEGDAKAPAASESVSATTNSRPAAGSSFDSVPPGKPAKTKSLAGVVIAMGAIGLVGVLGGVVGAIYVMKSAMGIQPTNISASANNVVAMQPQAATPTPAPSVPENPPAVASVAIVIPPSVDGEQAASPAPTEAIEAPEHAATKAKVPAHGVALPAAARVVATPAPTPKAAGKSSESKLPAGNAMPSLPPPADKAAKESTAAPPSNAGPFNRDAAMVVLSLAASRAASCKKPDGPTGAAKVHVTFDPSGAVVIANVVGSPIAGTPVAQCVANLFRRVKVQPFSGERASLSRDINIPP